MREQERGHWQVIAYRRVRAFPCFWRKELERCVLYDDMTRGQAAALCALLNRQQMGVSYQMQERRSDDDGL